MGEAARIAREKEELTFRAYDVDGDGMLDAEEITKYAKGEYDIELVKEKVAHILTTDAVKFDKEKNKAGTTWEKFMSLKTQLTIVREEIRAKQRNIERALHSLHSGLIDAGRRQARGEAGTIL